MSVPPGTVGEMTTTARRWVTDAALAALAIGVDVAGALAPHWGHHATVAHTGTLEMTVGIALQVIAGLALLARRPYPTATLAVVLAATLGAGALGAQNVWLALIIAFFSAVLRGRRWAAVASLVIGYGISLVHTPTTPALVGLAGLLAMLLVAEVIRARNARATAARREREDAAARRATEQRLAIARDLHDVVAHSISVINVQSNTALHLMDRHPDRAREALTAIREVSGQALAELGTVLGALRDGSAPLAPAPGVARLDELAARARAAGFSVSLSSDGEVRELPASVDAAAYRIVQEALTNAVRHSGGSSAAVLLRYAPGSVEIEVTDNGAGVTAPSDSGGNGLSGMSERTAALGGSFSAGPRMDGGFRVTARLPLPVLSA
jgi:signal transduction histidine kinase